MFNSYKKFYFFLVILCLTASTQGMQNERSNSSRLNTLYATITGFFATRLTSTYNFFKNTFPTRLFPRLPLSSLNPFSNYKFRKNVNQNNNIPLANENAELLNHIINTIETVMRTKAITEESWKNIERYVENGPNVNLRISERQVPLFTFTVIDGTEEQCNYLLNKKADINAVDKHGCTALHTTCRILPTTVSTQYLLQKGAKPNMVNESYNTPLSLAIACGKDINVVKSLIESQADVNHKYFNNDSLLKGAITSDRVEIIEELCKAGASLTNIDKYGSTVFDILIDNPVSTNAIITYSRLNFDDFKIEDNKKTSYKMLTVLLVFNRLHTYKVNNKEIVPYVFKDNSNSIFYGRIPKEIPYLILSHLLSTDDYHWKLYNVLLKNNYSKPRPSFLVKHHVNCLIKISQINNQNPHARSEKERVKDKLEKDLAIFNDNYLDTAKIPKENWAASIYEMQYKPEQLTQK